MIRLWAEKFLTRVTSGRAVLPEIDSLRFIAIMWVVLFHIYGSTPGRAETEASAWYLRPVIDFYRSGYFGVQLFFVISGFILSTPFAKYYFGKGGVLSIKQYFTRRLLRLEPPYMIHLFLISCLFAISCGSGLFWPIDLVKHGSPLAFLLRHNGASLLYSHDLLAGYANPINMVLWSLEVEVQFYILMPILAFVFSISHKTWRRFTLLSFILALSVLNATIFRSIPYGLFNLRIHLHWFLIGFLLSDLYLTEWKQESPHARKWDLLGVFSWIVVLTQSHTLFNTWWGIHLLPGLVLVCYLCVFRGKRLNYWFGNFWVSLVGGQCYTIYMYHYLLILLLGRQLQSYFPDDHGLYTLLIHTILISTIIILFSALMFVLFERPFMQRDWHLKVLERLGLKKRAVLDSFEV